MDSTLDATPEQGWWHPHGSAHSRPSWQQRLAQIVETMREMSRQTDPQKMVQAYGQRMRQILQTDASISLSRRDLTAPQYRITRSHLWQGRHQPVEARRTASRSTTAACSAT